MDDTLFPPVEGLGLEPGAVVMAIEDAESARWVEAAASIRRARNDLNVAERYVVSRMRQDGRLAWHEIGPLFARSAAQANRLWAHLDGDPLPGRVRRPRRGRPSPRADRSVS
jgi:hypothetical protein